MGEGDAVPRKEGEPERYAKPMVASRAANTALAIWFTLLTAVMFYVASLPGPFYPRHARPNSKPVPLWKARTFIILIAVWMGFGAVWAWLHR